MVRRYESRRFGFPVIIVLVVLAAFGYSSWRSAVSLVPPEWAPPDARPYTVIRVIDGDTIMARSRDGEAIRLRYLGVDAPETGPGTPEPFGPEATAANREWVEGRQIWVADDERRHDEHGRHLGYVFADGLFVNRELVAQGYAEAMLIRPNLRYAAPLLEAQIEARREGRGMWSRVVDVSDPTRLSEHVGAVVRLRGSVTDIAWGDEGRPTVITFRPFMAAADEGIPEPLGDADGDEATLPLNGTAPNGPRRDGSATNVPANVVPSVTLLVFPETRDHFPHAWADLSRGEPVEVTGRLQQRDRRFQIVVREPGQLLALAVTG